jgi:hypothetical protein
LLLAGAGVFGLALGCHHVAGVCDCDHTSVLTTGYPTTAPAAMTTQAPTMPRDAEQLKELPTPKEKDMGKIGQE